MASSAVFPNPIIVRCSVGESKLIRFTEAPETGGEYAPHFLILSIKYLVPTIIIKKLQLECPSD